MQPDDSSGEPSKKRSLKQPEQPSPKKKLLEPSQRLDVKNQTDFFTQNKMHEKIKDFLAPYLQKWRGWSTDKNTNGVYSEKEVRKLIIDLRAIIKLFLSDFASVCHENPDVIRCLKEENVLPKEFWDIALGQLHTARGMPQNMSPKSPHPNCHSLDTILGYYYAYLGLTLGEEQNTRKEFAFRKASEFNSLYGLLYSIKQLSQEITVKQDSMELKLLMELKKVNLLYGTPGYVSSAYFLFCVAERCPKIAEDCRALATLYTQVAETIIPHCTTAIKNLDPFDQENDSKLLFSGYEQILACCQGLMQQDMNILEMSSLKAEVTKEKKDFLKNGFYDLPTQENVLKFALPK